MFDNSAVSLEKQPEAAYKSLYLKQRLASGIRAKDAIAHIRLATRGKISYENSHPFMMRDKAGRTWTLAHNGTIFECDKLDALYKLQKGQTDSERVLCYIVEQMNRAYSLYGRVLTEEERFSVVDNAVCYMAKENKLNLIIFDGNLMYIHSNYSGSMYICGKEDTTVISTYPLDGDKWEPVRLNTLFAYQAGVLKYTGTNHGNKFFDDEEKMRMIYLDYAAL